MPAARGEGGGAGLVLEQPAGEAAAGPVVGPGQPRWPPGRRRRAEHPGQERRHAVVGQPLLGDQPAVAARGQLGPERAGVEDGLRRPACRSSSAWPMPSPVSGSHAPAASPTNSARPWARTARSTRAGIGQALWGAAATADGPQRLGDVGPGQQLGPQRLHVPDAAVPVRAGRRSRRWPARRAAGTTTRSRGAGPARTTPTGGWAAEPGDVVEVLAERVPLAEVAAASPSAERLAHGRPHAVGRDHVAAGHRAERVDVDHDAGRRRSDRTPVKRVAVVDLDPVGPGQVDQRGVERQPGHDGGELSHARSAGGSRPRARTVSAPTPRRSTCQPGTLAGTRPRCSSRRSAPVVRPSPQHLSRGKRALSTSTTSRPALASSMAAATPPGPPPTTMTSVWITGGQGRPEPAPSRRARRSSRSRRSSQRAPAETSQLTAWASGSGVAR